MLKQDGSVVISTKAIHPTDSMNFSAWLIILDFSTVAWMQIYSQTNINWTEQWVIHMCMNSHTHDMCSLKQKKDVLS